MLKAFARATLAAPLFIAAAGISASAGVPGPSSDAAVAKAQLQVARQIHRQATLIVAVVPRSIIAEEPNASPFRTQNYTVSGKVARCFAAGARPPSEISYVITSEGRPRALDKPHIAFLRRAGGQWTALDGPMFRDSAPMRAGLIKMTKGCAR